MNWRGEQRRSVTELLFALSGPAIWFLHFGSLYGIQSFGCSVAESAPSWFSGVLWTAIIIVSFVSIFALGGLLVTGYQGATNSQSAGDEQNESDFLHYVQFAIAGLALIGVTWTTLAAVIIPVCTPVFGN